MKIVTFNLRCEVPQDGINAFVHRKGHILDKIDQQQPDIIGFQECRPQMESFLKAHLHGYSMFGRQRGDHWSESNPIAFRTDAFDLIGLVTGWLSPTPNVPASRYEPQSICPRVFTHAILEPRDGSSPIHAINAHFDHEFAEARTLAAKQLIRYMKSALATDAYPLVMTGDFNAHPDEECIKLLLGDGMLALVDCTRDIEHSFHGYGRVTQPRIDYILARDFLKTAPAQAWEDECDGIYLSDHYPLAAELRPLK